MEEIYASVESAKQDNPKPSTNHTGSKTSKRNASLSIIVFWSLLGVLLLTRLVTLGVHYFIVIKDSDSLKANLSNVRKKLAIMTEERDLLRANLTENLKELERLQSLCKQKKTCPEGWSNFNHSCYLLSESSGSWDAARKDCRDRQADLVVINSPEEQTAILKIATEEAWIGLNDKEQEGTWKWVDGTPLTLMYWKQNQPDNGGGVPKWGEEDCVHFSGNKKQSWNDRSCSDNYKWICEKQF
ncbi:CD209 antigen-like protein E [Oreochromis niloticus]|uniref:CD209 antigen-like protein E n=1 Tax=Oreochromis niloticus TaxID=8128 RepID=A0A669F2P7_ORENI|nr:CD209 antigen-like protein E [Oreochromis niloticus]